MIARNKTFKILFLSMFLIFSVFGPLLSLSAHGAEAKAIVPCNGVDGGSNTANGVEMKECTFDSLIELFNRIIRFLLFDLAAPLATLAFVYAGFLYITAAGDTGKIAKAHDIFKSVLIGLILAFGAFLIVTAILSGLGTKDDIVNQVIQKK